MSDQDQSASELRELLLRVLSISASLAGFCVAAIGLLNSHAKSALFAGLGDDLLAFAAVCFLCCTYLSFWALRTRKEERLRRLSKVVDVLFLAGLTIVVVSGIGIVYSIA